MKKLFNSPQVWGPLLIVTAASLWSVDGILRRELFVLPAISIVFYEHLIGSMLLLPMSAQFLKIKLTKRILTLTAIVALFSGLLGTLWFTQALISVQFIPFSVVFLLQKLQPIFAILAARWLLKERLHKHFFGWATLAVVASYFVTFPNGVVNTLTGSGTQLAAMLAIGAAVAWGASTAVSKLLLKEVPVVVATQLRFTATTIFAIPLILWLKVPAAGMVLNSPQVSKLIFIALSTGMVALWLYYKGLVHTQAKVATILELTFPLLAVMIDAFLYQTWLLPTQYVAAGVLLFAMINVVKQGQKQSAVTS